MNPIKLSIKAPFGARDPLGRGSKSSRASRPVILVRGSLVPLFARFDRQISRLAGLAVDGRLAFAFAAAVSALVALRVIPELHWDGDRDWMTFARGGEWLQAGLPLYSADSATPSNLYPPAMALLWSIGLNSAMWLLLELAALIPVIYLVAGPRPRVASLALLGLQAPVAFDLITGNVTCLYLGAIACLLAFRGWRGAIPLGVMLAIAAKPALVPFVLVTLIVSPRQAARVIAVAAALSLVTAGLVGAERYVEYFQALLAAPGQLATWSQGNLGIVRLAPSLTGLAIVAALAVTAIAARRFRPPTAYAIALGASVLVQPSLGYYYAAYLIPAVLLMYRVSRLAALVAAIGAPFLAVSSPVYAGLLVISAALVGERATVPPANPVAWPPGAISKPDLWAEGIAGGARLNALANKPACAGSLAVRAELDERQILTELQ